MKNLRTIYLGLIATTFIISCAPKDLEFETTQSTADFSKYIAIGNSLTAGFADGGLYLSGQEVAYPNLIAEKMQAVGGGSFTSPFFNQDQANGSGYIQLTGFDANGLPLTGPVTDRLAIRGVNSAGGPLYTKYTGAEYHNYGVPWMRMDWAVAAPQIGAPEGNPYYERLLTQEQAGTVTYMAFTTQRNHTFFSFWLGNNDILGYAMNGAVTSGPTNAFTGTATFTALLDTYLNSLTQNNVKGVLANIPDVTAIPYFTTVTFAQLLGAIRAVNPAVEAVFIQTKDGPRPATANDLFFLTFPAQQLGRTTDQQPIPWGLDPRNPINDNLVLDAAEVREVQQRTREFNNAIKAQADEKDLAFVDVYAFMNRVRDGGYVYNGIPLTSAFITGNGFSLDGIHLTPIGNAVVANLFIDAINKKYGGSIPKVDVTQYSGVRMPN